jgi:deazaflavin-dependent oxidoreductase (nitroreductase family)
MKQNVKLTTTGRRSGSPRQVTLYAFEDGDRLVVVGSLGGAAKDPAWVGNLRVEPHATIRLGGEARDVRAHEIDGTERDRLWTLVTKEFPMYASYQRKTERVIPLFSLETVSGA